MVLLATFSRVIQKGAMQQAATISRATSRLAIRQAVTYLDVMQIRVTMMPVMKHLVI